MAVMSTHIDTFHYCKIGHNREMDSVLANLKQFPDLRNQTALKPRGYSMGGMDFLLHSTCKDVHLFEKLE